MSQVHLSNFSWPTAVPGALDQPKGDGPVPSSCTDEAMTTVSVTIVSKIYSITDAIFSAADKSVHVTMTSTIMQALHSDSSEVHSISPTLPHDAHAPILPSKTRKLVPDLTVASFELLNPTADPTISLFAAATTSSSDSLVDDSASSLPSLSSSAIAGISLGAVALVCILTALAVYSYRSRKAKNTQPDAEAADPQDFLDERVERARDFRRKRWSAQQTRGSRKRFDKLKAALAEKKGEAIAEEVEAPAVADDQGMKTERMQHDRSRRPSGLAMHPPTL